MNQVGTNYNTELKYIKVKPSFKADYALPDNAVQIPQAEIPDTYYMPESLKGEKTFKDKIKSVDLMGLVYPWLENPLMMLGSCIGLGYAVDKLGSTFQGEYAKSSVAKAADFGDKIAQSKFIQSKPSQTVLGGVQSGWNRFAGLFKNSDLVNAIFKTPSQPEWSMPKNEMFSHKQRLVEEFMHIVNTYHINDDGVIKATDLGISKAEREMVEKALGKNFSKLSQNEIVTQVMMKRLNPGISQGEINSIISLGNGALRRIKDDVLKTLGLQANQLKDVNIEKIDDTFIKQIEDACKRAGNKVKIGDGHWKILGNFQPFERQLGCDGIFNKLHSMGSGTKTKTGRFMSQFVQKLYRGFTFGGGKLGVLLFISPAIVEAIKNTRKAEPDEKLGTIAQNTIPHLTWVFTFPLALQIFHAFGGMKYAGNSHDQVTKFRDELKAFNEKAKAGKFTEIDYNNEIKRIKNLLKVDTKVHPQNLLTKIGKKVGSFLTMDLEMFEPFKNNNQITNFLRKLPNSCKNLFGVPMRFILWGVISMGVLESAITKGIRAIFGKSYDSMKEEEYKTKKEQQEEFAYSDLKTRLAQAQYKKLNPEPVQETTPVKPMNNDFRLPIQNTQPAENIETTVKDSAVQVTETVTKETVQPTVENRDNYTYIPKQNSEIKPAETQKRDNYTYIPSQENVLKAQENEFNVNKYIPSQQAGKFTKTFDNSGLANALKRADRAEQQAIKVLSGKFQG